MVFGVRKSYSYKNILCSYVTDLFLWISILAFDFYYGKLMTKTTQINYTSLSPQ